MYLSRITFDVGANLPGAFEKLKTGTLYGVHEILWKLFPVDPDAQRDFLFRKETKNRWPLFYMVSKRQPRSPNPAIIVESKPYEPKIKHGQQLSFSLRTNPVVTKKNEKGKRSRHDVVMDAKKSLARPFRTEESVSSGELQHTVGARWLAARSENAGFKFDANEVRVFGYLQHRFKSRKQASPIKLSTLDFKGRLIVTAPEKFCHTLFDGLGPAKAFGCGLMLVRRI